MTFRGESQHSFPCRKAFCPGDEGRVQRTFQPLSPALGGAPKRSQPSGSTATCRDLARNLPQQLVEVSCLRELLPGGHAPRQFYHWEQHRRRTPTAAGERSPRRCKFRPGRGYTRNRAWSNHTALPPRYRCDRSTSTRPTPSGSPGPRRLAPRVGGTGRCSRSPRAVTPYRPRTPRLLDTNPLWRLGMEDSGRRRKRRRWYSLGWVARHRKVARRCTPHRRSSPAVQRCRLEPWRSLRCTRCCLQCTSPRSRRNRIHPLLRTSRRCTGARFSGSPFGPRTGPGTFGRCRSRDPTRRARFRSRALRQSVDPMQARSQGRSVTSTDSQT